MPTSHGDYLDRAINTLAKEMNLDIPLELSNSLAVQVGIFILIMNFSNMSQMLLSAPLEKTGDTILSGWNNPASSSPRPFASRRW